MATEVAVDISLKRPAKVHQPIANDVELQELIARPRNGNTREIFFPWRWRVRLGPIWGLIAPGSRECSLRKSVVGESGTAPGPDATSQEHDVGRRRRPENASKDVGRACQAPKGRRKTISKKSISAL